MVVGDFQNNILVFAKFVRYKGPQTAERFGEYKYHNKKDKKQKPQKTYGIEIVGYGVRVMAFNATFNNISVILVEDTGENHRLVVSH